MKKSLTIVMVVVLVFLAVACSPESTQHVHDWGEGKVTLEPGCLTNGERTYTCSICKDSKTETIQATGHKHANVKGTKETEGNCVTSGVYKFICTKCGESFSEIITPAQAKESKFYKNDFRHVYQDEEGNYETYSTELKEAQKQVRYYDDDIEAETMFTPKSQKAYCVSCGENLPEYNKVITSGTSAATYALMDGTFVVTMNADGYKGACYIDVVEKKETNGSITRTINCVYSTYSEKEGWITGKADPNEVTMTTSSNGIRALNFGGSVLSDEAGEYTLENSKGENQLIVEGKTVGKVEFKQGHHHKYGENATSVSDATSEQKAGDIYFDSYFKVMQHLGMNYITDTCHYVYCPECGLSYYPVKHLDKGGSSYDDTCYACGYDDTVLESDNKKGYFEVAIKKVEETELGILITTTKTAATAANTAAKAAKDAVSNASSTDAYAALSAAETAVKNAKNALEAVGKKLKESEKSTIGYDARIAALEALLNSEGEASASLTKAKEGLTETGGVKVNGDTSYSTVLGSAATALSNSGSYAADPIVAGANSVSKALSDAADILNSRLYEVSETVERFCVQGVSVLNLDYVDCTSFSTIKFCLTWRGMRRCQCGG